MISIVVCSTQRDIPETLKQNIASTIGAPYELVIIDNSQNEYSIFSAYNKGVQESHGDIICFMHEDILFYSTDWGAKVESLLNSHPNVGACAIAGSRHLRKAPSYYPGPKFTAINIIQADKHSSEVAVWQDYSTPLELAVFDGVWFCIKRSLFQHIAFDEKHFKGFHFYDIDISMQIQQAGYRILTIPDILLKHFSGGNINRAWLKNAVIFHNKWKDYLPISHTNISSQEAYILECKALYSLLRMSILMRLWKITLRWFSITYNVVGFKGFYHVFAYHTFKK